MSTSTANTLPDDLPVPEASHAALHLGGHPLPPLIELASTSGGFVDLFLLSLRRPVLLFIYPRTAAAKEQVPDDWNAIAGARGCTPELCNVRDHYNALLERERRGASEHDESSSLAVFGLSTQSTAYQREAVERLRLPFPLLSDGPAFALQKALDLPTFRWRDETYLQRCTLLLRDGQVTQYQHPVFPPNKAAEEALKMLDAGKSGAAAMPISSTCDVRDSGVMRDGVEVAGGGEARDLTGSIRSFAGLQQRRSVSQSTESRRSLGWRNSLVAVDTLTGEVVGVLAHGVSLSSDDADNQVEPRLLPYTSATTYHDPDVRPRSRANSILGADTFAPPPVPDKSASSVAPSSDGSDDSDGESIDACFSDGEAVDGLVRTRAAHVERHRPDLLRDEYDDEYGTRLQHINDASGSTVGGAAVQLWRKARGGRKGEEKRRAKKQARRAALEAAAAAKQAPPPPPARKSPVKALDTAKAWSEVRDAVVVEPALYPPSTETIDAARAQRMQQQQQQRRHDDDDVQAIEDNVWRSALESGALPIDAAYTHLPARKMQEQQQQQKRVDNVVAAPTMQGNSVLIEFLAGSRITASVVRDAATSLFRPSSKPASTSAAAVSADDNSPTALALRYMPVLPDHLLWFFGMARAEPTMNTEASVRGELLRTLSTTSVISAAFTAAALPTQWIATTAWQLSLSAGDWIGTGFAYVTGAKQDATATAKLSDEELYRDWNATQPGDEDADEWEWQMPPGAYNVDDGANELGNTPRPVYRRKRPVPSLYGGFNVRQSAQDRHPDAAAAQEDGKRQRREGSRYSIVHFDHEGVGRHAVMRAAFSP